MDHLRPTLTGRGSAPPQCSSLHQQPYHEVPVKGGAPGAGQVPPRLPAGAVRGALRRRRNRLAAQGYQPALLPVPRGSNRQPPRPFPTGSPGSSWPTPRGSGVTAPHFFQSGGLEAWSTPSKNSEFFTGVLQQMSYPWGDEQRASWLTA